jgi:two-component system response regulator YesN
MPVLFYTDSADQSFTWKPMIQSLALELIQQFEQQ